MMCLRFFIAFVVGKLAVQAAIYPVGPGKTFQNIGEVPLESLKAGDTVKIFWRVQPYFEKFVVSGEGTATMPIVIIGIPSATGLLPIISGDGAVTRQNLDFWSEARGIIKIGGSSIPANTPSWIVLQQLDLRTARPGFYLLFDHGVQQEYLNNAAAVFIENGENIVVNGCKISDCSNGLFVAYQSAKVTIAHNEIFGNGMEGSSYEHNTYTEASGIIYQFNSFGPI